jgi:hypothetical protein
MESLDRDKHSSFLRTFVNYGRKKFYDVGSRKWGLQGKKGKNVILQFGFI